MRPPRLLDQVRDRIRRKHYSMRTEEAYAHWIKRFILFHGERHPHELGAIEVERFLTHLAVAGRVSASTQNQAKSALLFLYKEVLGQDLPWLDNVESARRSKRVPVVLTAAEVEALLQRVTGTVGLMLRMQTCVQDVLPVSVRGPRMARGVTTVSGPTAHAGV